MHSLMGIQVGVPIALCLLFEINVLVMGICLLSWALHELVAHWDVHHAMDIRRISIWEMHAHNYLATLPLLMVLGVIATNWPTFVQLVSLNWANQLSLMSREFSTGAQNYQRFYLLMVLLLGVLPYVEENVRCLKAAINNRGVSQ